MILNTSIPFLLENPENMHELELIPTHFNRYHAMLHHKKNASKRFIKRTMF